MKSKLIEWYGWYGTVAIVLAYILVSFSVIPVTSIWYQLLNCTGALGIVLVSFQDKDYPPCILNIIWTAIAFFSILKIIL